MSETKACPRCSGTMSLGALKEIGHYGNSPYEWASLNEPPFRVKGQPSNRYGISVYRCEKCGFLEMYAPQMTS